MAALNAELDNCGTDISGLNTSNAHLATANLSGASMTFLQNCPFYLSSGYISELHPDCGKPYRYRSF